MFQIVTPKIECTQSSDNSGSYSVTPLKPGFGITLGNALRRIALSSLQGAAVTWVKIEGVSHQFSTIPYMKEDVIEFLLNVKTLRLRSLVNQQGRLYLDVNGERRVYASDIQPSAEFEIVDPELHLATLDSPEAKLCVEFNVQQGVGYQPATRDSDLPIGVIPVDAIFSPIRKFNYEVEPIHIGQETYDKLIIEIRTDGTISPPEAISQSAQLLIAQLGAFVDLPETLIKETKEEEQIIPSEKYTMPVESLGLTTQVLNCLRRNNITTVGELTKKSDKELLNLPKFGPKALKNVKEQLSVPGIIAEESEKEESLPTPSAAGEEVDAESEAGEMVGEMSEASSEQTEQIE